MPASVALHMFLLSQILATSVVKYGIQDPFDILHRYYQPGDIIFGSIGSQSIILSSPKAFDEQPPQKLSEEAM